MEEIRVVAVYENGVLKPEKPLELKEGEKVLLVVKRRHPQKGYGLLEWTGDPEVAHRIALDPEFSILESP